MNFNHIVVQNILRDKSTYISYFLSSVFSILVFFLFSTTAFHPMMAELDTTSTLGMTMMLASFFIYIFSFVFIIYSLFAFLKKKTKTLGVFMITGASMRQIRKMVFRENMLIAGAAIITAIAIGFVIAPLFLMVTKKVLRAESFGMYVPIPSILLTIVLFTLLFLIVSKFMTRLIKKEEIVKLLKADITQEKLIVPAPFKMILSNILSVFLLISIIKEMNWVKSFETVSYIALFISFLFAIYYTITQGTLLAIRVWQRRTSYLRKTNMLFVSNLKAKGRSHAHIIYLLTVLLLGVFVCTSVLYSSYYNVKEKTEALYPYSFQYTSLPDNTSEVEKDITFIESTLDKVGKYDAYYLAFKTDEERRIGFMSVSDFNELGQHKPITLSNNEYYVVAGNEGVRPNTEDIHGYPFGILEYAGLEEQNILSTGLQNVFYIIPDKVYETIEYPVYKVFAYELDKWTNKINVANTILSEVSTEPGMHLMASKIDLYDAEKFVKSIMFFIGFMLSLIFMSAAMSILYFYLQTSLEGEKEKYAGIRKIGFSVKELASVVTKELATLTFIPFTIAALILLATMFIIRNYISSAFYQLTAIGLGIFLFLFIISFFIIRRAYLNKLVD
ncbi:ABC transporter permease [Cytobacillus horneckiae]|uniref:ABC transporter permease n=1 Tax=Cytobacillus horneckiae TaxID=549687 RepID=A0A2N0ZJC9_9BACI|nr:FtsX-like permease family protein [Cytobacillus horneckiae]MCM3180658.1 FtsX-like permease family protein [Cytobacillus horneckiae]MEC1153967.1 FtsX-like permease family protein [Cytobacillus horneckiae]MED2938542.1 FtsX-like permease family protein [Cytobacillus horneckiae]PKG29594.1 ABC transporter permease [Cytobacillus horneckiae]